VGRHDDFLAELLSRLPGQIFLVNRYADAGLGLPEDDVLRVFLPDLHLVSGSSESVFSYRFNGLGAPAGKKPLFATLLDALEGTARGGALELFQLGDRYDLWREAVVEWQAGARLPDPAILRDRIRTDPRLAPLLSRLEGLPTTFLRGNHDHLLGKLAGRPAEAPVPDETTAAGGRIFLTHGHRWDQIEGLLPDDVKAWGVRVFPRPRVAAYGIGFYTPKQVASIRLFLQRRRTVPGFPFFPDLRPAGPKPLGKAGDADLLGSLTGAFLDVTGFSHATDGTNDFENRDSMLEFGFKIWNGERENADPAAARRVYVFGHTHRARLLVDEHPLLGGPLVSMDCGAWVENCRLSDERSGASYAAPSAQIGVQCGNDLRIYQLGGALAVVRRTPRVRVPRPAARRPAAAPRRSRTPRSRRSR